MKKEIVPESFDAHAYLEELIRQLPGRAGRMEIGRQLAATLGRGLPWSQSYIGNLHMIRQKMTDNVRRALFRHSRGRESP